MSQPTKDEGICLSSAGEADENNNLDATQQFDVPQFSAEHNLQKNAPVGELSSFGSLGLSGPETGFTFKIFTFFSFPHM